MRRDRRSSPSSSEACGGGGRRGDTARRRYRRWHGGRGEGGACRQRPGGGGEGSVASAQRTRRRLPIRSSAASHPRSRNLPRMVCIDTGELQQGDAHGTQRPEVDHMLRRHVPPRLAPRHRLLPLQPRLAQPHRRRRRREVEMDGWIEMSSPRPVGVRSFARVLPVTHTHGSGGVKTESERGMRSRAVCMLSFSAGFSDPQTAPRLVAHEPMLPRAASGTRSCTPTVVRAVRRSLVRFGSARARLWSGGLREFLRLFIGRGPRGAARHGTAATTEAVSSRWLVAVFEPPLQKSAWKGTLRGEADTIECCSLQSPPLIAIAGSYSTRGG